MFARTYGAATLGVDGLIIDVEVDASSGLPAFDLVGLPDTAVRESKERVRTAIRNTGLRLRQEKVTVNLAPADIRKDSSGLDLPIAVGLLAAYGIVPAERIRKSLFAAELSLEGECRPIRGVLPMAIQAKKEGFANFFVAKDNADEALLVDGLHIYALDNLHQLVCFLSGETELSPAVPVPRSGYSEMLTDDFSDVQGQFQAKRALEIAAAGGHNVLMVGVPGSGKTMLARRVSTILPALSQEEALEVTKIYSIAGLVPRHGGLVTQRPYRSPHHTSSMTAMIGGGTIPRPGEVTLAHHGVLFLDELPEFSKKTLEVLREPLDIGWRYKELLAPQESPEGISPGLILLLELYFEIHDVLMAVVEVAAQDVYTLDDCQHDAAAGRKIYGASRDSRAYITRGDLLRLARRPGAQICKFGLQAQLLGF